MTTAPDKPRRHICFFLGCIVLVLTAAAHTAAHLQGPPPNMTEEQANLHRLMQSVPIEAFGQQLTMDGINNGLSWFFAAALLLQGALGAALWATRRADRTLMRLVAAFYSLFLASMTGVSALDFPLPATIFLGVGTLMFLLGLVTA